VSWSEYWAHRLTSTEHNTLIHGDAHLWNFLHPKDADNDRAYLVDLESCVETIEIPSNLLYHWRFMRSLKTRMRRKARLFPDRFDASLLQGVRSIRQFDDTFTAPHCGFKDSADYYKRASSLPYMPDIAIPTLIIHAKDDPLIPYAPFERQEVRANPSLFLLAPENGGHVGFVSVPDPAGDRFWAETKAIEFFKALRS